MEKSIIIIGAGISGLAAGCYGRMNGYNTRIFEMHSIPGGLCTAWERKDFIIDGCLHWLVGTKPNTPLYNIWKELGIIQDQKIIYMDEFYQVEGPDGKVFHLYTNIDRLEKHMNDLSPDDASVTEEFINAVRRFIGFTMPVGKAPELYNTVDGLGIMFRMGTRLSYYRKWSKITIKEFASRFKSALFRLALELVWPGEMALVFLLITLAELHERAAGYIIGGSLAISQAIEKRYLALGGKISYKTGVEKILVANNHAMGVKLVDGTEYKADYVISAADVYATVFNMLDGKYVDDKIRSYFVNRPIFKPLVYIGLGVNRSFDDVPQTMSGILLPLDKPLMVGEKEVKWLPVRIHNFDPTLAPHGKTLLTVAIESDFAYWAPLHEYMVRYKAEKEQIALAVVQALNKRFPGLVDQLEMWDVATPYTFYRYTGNWHGGYEGWLPTPENANLSLGKTLPGLDKFYMISQWTQPSGGLPPAAMNGSHIIQILCKQDKKKFQVSRP
jgi:phytoene dehydrogenase-like protein